MNAATSVRSSSTGITRLEVAGAFGDIGVLFPIAIALITLNRLNPTAVFLAAGMAYLFAGWYFQIPISVQPLKAVAAIALAFGLPSSAIASSGLIMGVLLALIGLTNTAAWLAKLFTLPIVRGIQLGLGLLLMREGMRLIMSRQATLIFANGTSVRGWALASIAAALLLALRNSPRFPAALFLLSAGIAVGVVAQWGHFSQLAFGPQPIILLHPNRDELWRILFLLVIPQFALTFGNSIVATENTAQILHGRQARRVTARGLSFSIALINLFSGMIQSAPMCHGSGGITAHYKFGARTSRASYIIGGVCVALALFGRAATDVLRLIPIAVLAVFLLYVGVQHAAYLKDIAQRRLWLLIAVMVGVVSLVTTNLMWGFLTGFALQMLLVIYERTSARLRPAYSPPRPSGS